MNIKEDSSANQIKGALPICYHLWQVHLERSNNGRHNVRNLGLTFTTSDYKELWNFIDSSQLRSDQEIVRIGFIFSDNNVQKVPSDYVISLLLDIREIIHNAVTDKNLYNQVFTRLQRQLRQDANVTLIDLILYDIHKVKSVNLELTNFITHFPELK
jgi:hypothetical protein